jgi:endonuclease YncB( thermonuclease family)
MSRIPVLLIAALLSTLALPAQSAEPIPGPINARVVSVYDGDTFTADAMPWPGVTVLNLVGGVR